MRYRIQHTTHYEYANPVSLGYNRAHLLPRDTEGQRCLNTQIQINPLPSFAQYRKDYFGNNTYHFSLEHAHESLTVDVITEVEVGEQTRLTNFDLDLGISCDQALQMVQQSQDEQALLAREYLLDSPLVHRSTQLADYARPLFQPGRTFLSAVRALTEQIHRDFAYDPKSTTVATPLNEVMEHKRGVCQDFSHVAIGCLRSLGYPARYVSGYLETLPPPGQEKLVGSDASHAWFAAFSPSEGWFEFDPTNNNIPADQHIVTAWGRDYSDVPPLRGVIFDGGGKQKIKVSVDVQRLESPGFSSYL